MNKQKITSLELLCGLCFSLCFFSFMLTEAFINERCVLILGSATVNYVYTFGLVCTGLGFLSYSFLCKIVKTENARKRAMMIIGALYLMAATVLLFADRPAIFLMSAAAALLLIGHIGSCMYCHAAFCFDGSRYTGRVIGTGMGSAIFLQFIVQNLTEQPVVFMACILVSIAFTIYFINQTPTKKVLRNPVSHSTSTHNGGKTVLVLIIAVVLMSLVAGMIDSVLTAFNAEKAYNIYSGVRLFYAFGLLLAGVIADIGERNYLPLATVCAILLSTISMFFLSEEVSYFAGTALMYLYSGFYVIFFTIMFLDFAPKSRCPQLWAGMGRIVRSFTVAVIVLPSLRIHEVLGNTILAVGSCLVSIGILLVLLPHIGWALTASQQNKEIAEQKEKSPQERLELYARHCSLTPRETEVLEMLLTTDDDLQGIADNLYISRRMVQRYVSSIYEKTKTKTRLGLFQSYINFSID